MLLEASQVTTSQKYVLHEAFQNHAELVAAIDSEVYDSSSPYGPIEGWDVSMKLAFFSSGNDMPL